MLKFLLPLFTIIFLLAGCGIEQGSDSNGNTNDLVGWYNVKPSPFAKVLDSKLITDVTDNSILVGDVYYEITENTKILNSKDQPISFNNLKPGSLIKLHASGDVDKTSYPGKSVAKIVKLQTDQESIQVSRAIQHYIEQWQGGLLTGAWINGGGKERIHLRFYDTEAEKQYEATISLVSNEASEREIESVAKEKAKGGSGTTAGHITEIHEDGFRINMADYAITNETAFTSDSEEVVSKDTFKIGDFVSVDYSEYKGEGIIKEAKLKKLTLLKSEEKPGVQEWVKSVLEGPLYKDPVIMSSYKGRMGESYTIRVADLQDDTWDTFEVTYDFNTGEQSVERIEHIQPSNEPTPYDDINDYQIVQGVGKDRVFIHNKFEYLDEDIMETIDGEKIAIEDLEVGSLIKFEYTPIDIERSVLTKIIWRNDELYADISASIRHFIENQQEGAIHSLYIYNIDDEQIVLKFRKDGQEMQHKAVIDRQTNEYEVEEDIVK